MGLSQNEKANCGNNDESHKIEPKTNWKSLYLLTAFGFFDGVQYSMFIVSLWPYLNTIDPSTGASFFGIITAGFSFGQAIGSPLLGYWMNRVKSIRQPMTAGLIIQILSNAIYGCMENFHQTDRRYIMLASRILVGFGTGTVAVMRAYVANASVPKDRAKAITMLAASWICGITVGPGIQVGYSPIGYPGFKIFDFFHFDMYTAPAFLASIIDLLCLILLWTMLQEEYVGLAAEQKKEDPLFALPKPKLVPIFICIFARFTLMFTITNMEAIGSMFTMAMYEWTNQEAVKYNGFIQLAQAGISLSANIAFAVKLADYISNGHERTSAIIGLFVGLIYHLVTYAWPFLPDRPGYRIEYSPNNASTELIGCYTSKFQWCSYTHQVPLWLYVGATGTILGLSFPMTFVPINTLFSKILGERRQGTMMGIFFMAGSIGRTIGPIIAAFMFEHYGPEATWGLQIGMILLTILLWVICYKKVVPLDANPKLKPGQYYRYDRGVKYYF